MSNYTPTGKPQEGSRYVSKDIRDEFILIKNALNSKADFTTPTFDSQVTFDVSPLAPTPTTGDNSTKVATTEFVQNSTLDGALPSQSGNSGKYLTTNGSVVSWGAVSSVPDQTSHSGKVLTTNGTTASWTQNFASLTDSNTFTNAQNTARATVASHATTADIWGAAGNEINFTGTATVTDFPDAPQAGAVRTLYLSDAVKFVHSASLIVQGNIDYTAEDGDIVIVRASAIDTFKLEIIRQSGSFAVMPIFSSGTVGKMPITTMDEITPNSYDPSLGSGEKAVSYGSGLFVVSNPSVSQATVASSPTGETWTARTMPSAEKWAVASDGSNFLAINTDSGTSRLEIATSADGITWSAATNLPGNTSGSNPPVSLAGSTFFVPGSGTTLYKTDDLGSTWSTQTMAATPAAGVLYKVGGILWFWVSGTTAYTSSTGLTSSWTSRTLPDTPNGATIQEAVDGSLLFINSARTILYRSTDGINWSSLSITMPAVNTPMHYFNGVYLQAFGTGQTSYTYHGSTRVQRTASLTSNATVRRVATNGSGALMFGVSGNVTVIDNSIKGAFA